LLYPSPLNFQKLSRVSEALPSPTSETAAWSKQTCQSTLKV
jgi:hypothetical protein